VNLFRGRKSGISEERMVAYTHYAQTTKKYRPITLNNDQKLVFIYHSCHAFSVEVTFCVKVIFSERGTKAAPKPGNCRVLHNHPGCLIFVLHFSALRFHRILNILAWLAFSLLSHAHVICCRVSK
jgi:hypothetical protein